MLLLIEVGLEKIEPEKIEEIIKYIEELKKKRILVKKKLKIKKLKKKYLKMKISLVQKKSI